MDTESFANMLLRLLREQAQANRRLNEHASAHAVEQVAKAVEDTLYEMKQNERADKIGRGEHVPQS